MVKLSHISLTPFSLAVLLTLARIQRFTKKVMVFLKQICLAYFKDSRKAITSSWLKQLYQIHQQSVAIHSLASGSSSSSTSSAALSSFSVSFNIADSMFADFYKLAIDCAERSIVRHCEWDHIFPSLVGTYHRISIVLYSYMYISSLLIHAVLTSL
jgi:hypothetical protein